MVELVKPLKEKTFDNYAGEPDNDWRDNQSGPVAKARIFENKICCKGAHHVLGTMTEVDDVEHAENDGKPEAQQRIEGPVDQTDQQLTEQRSRWYAEDLEHSVTAKPRGERRPAPRIFN